MTMSAIPGLSAPMSADVDIHRLQKSDPPHSTLNDPSDPSALRQAALKSIRNKRRKPVPGSDTSVLSARPIAPSQSIQLDYGQEDSISAGTSASTPQAALPAAIAAPNSLGGASEGEVPYEDATMREEGEISENEEPPSTPASKPPPPPNISANAPEPRKISPLSRTTPPPPPPPPTAPPRTPLLHVKLEPSVPSLAPTPPRSASLSRPGTAGFAVPMTPTTLNTDSFRIETFGYVIDADHVRPGLSLNQEQYNTAKDIVLDLLGWGVPPEYLVDCGLSREIVFYVFSELNLRFPANLDTTGIPPFPPPPEVVASLLGAPDLLPETPKQRSGSFVSRNHRNLPQRPSAPQASAIPFVPRATAPTNSDAAEQTVAVASSSDGSLAAMEQMKRQELLARKAVQASRRRKDSSFTAAGGADEAPSNGPRPETKPKVLVPESSVDDFLKTIGPTSSNSSSGGVSRQNSFMGAPLARSPDAMDVDDDIPGLGISEHTPVSPSPRSSSERQPSAPDSMDLSDPDNSPEERAVELSLGLDTNDLGQEDIDMDLLDAASLLANSGRSPITSAGLSRSSVTPQPAAPIPRRGMKRPVAADFVDIDPGSSNPYSVVPPSRTGSIWGFTNGGTHHPNPHVRRKMNAVAAGGFASIGSNRRCVIDLSDSEDGDEDDDDRAQRLKEVTVLVPEPPSPAASLEMEIERMRALIKEREEQKRRKMAVSGRTTPLSRAALATGQTSQPPASVKSDPPVAAVAVAEQRLTAQADASIESKTPLNGSATLDSIVPLSFQNGSSRDSVTSIPIDDSSAPATSGVRHNTTGGQVLTAEARQEQVVPGTPQASGPSSVDVVASAQDTTAQHPQYRTYDSVLSHYPYLSGGSLDSQGASAVPDLKPLKLRVALKQMTGKLEEATICQYEVPGGGECRDATCSNLHLSRFAVEPSDEETAQYLGGDVGLLARALGEVRARMPRTTYEERVGEAWRIVGRHPR